MQKDASILKQQLHTTFTNFCGLQAYLVAFSSHINRLAHTLSNQWDLVSPHHVDYATTFNNSITMSTSSIVYTTARRVYNKVHRNINGRCSTPMSSGSPFNPSSRLSSPPPFILLWTVLNVNHLSHFQSIAYDNLFYFLLLLFGSPNY